MATHLGAGWSFAYDNAKRRAGLCNFSKRRISMSRYLTARYDDATNEQTLLHEIAHALCGPDIGHGPLWRRTARRLGYTGGRTLSGASMDDLAPWEGVCPSGHRVYRHRRPTRVTTCGRCARTFDERFTISWRHREITREARRAALASA